MNAWKRNKLGVKPSFSYAENHIYICNKNPSFYNLHIRKGVFKFFMIQKQNERGKKL